MLRLGRARTAGSFRVGVRGGPGRGWNWDEFVITIQSAMLITLGFLAASLLALLFAPVFWRRAVRLTTRRMKEAMPLTEAEIQADKDRLRAEHAIRVHRLESQAEQVQMAMARQKIDLSRRDSSINVAAGALERLQSALEEALNARRVLEQTVSDRLPRVEHRLGEARKLIFNPRSRDFRADANRRPARPRAVGGCLDQRSAARPRSSAWGRP